MALNSAPAHSGNHQNYQIESGGNAGTSNPMPQQQTAADAEPGQASDADDTTASASVAHDGVGGTVMVNNKTPPAASDIADGARERSSAVLKWVNSGIEDDAVALIEVMLDQRYLSLSGLFKLIETQLVAAQPPVSRALSQNLPNSSTLNATSTLWSHIGSAAEMPMHGRLPVPSASSATAPASNAYLDSGFLPSSSYPTTFLPAATPAAAVPPVFLPSPYYALGHDAQFPAVPPPFISDPYCPPGHGDQLQIFAVMTDTNPSLGTKRLSKSDRSFVQSDYTEHGQYPAVLATTASALNACGSAPSALSYHRSSSVPGSSAHMASERKTAKQDWKSGNCSRCDATRSSQWRRDPETKEQLCNRCGQKAHAAHKKQREREQEHNPPTGEEAAATSFARSVSRRAERTAERQNRREGPYRERRG